MGPTLHVDAQTAALLGRLVDALEHLATALDRAIDSYDPAGEEG